MAAEKEEMAKQGLAEAIDKLEAAPNERSAQVQLGNALKWIHSLEEWHKLRLGKSAHGDYRYFPERDGTPEGQLVGALVYARAYQHHRLAVWSDFQYPGGNLDIYVDKYGELTWVSAAPERLTSREVVGIRGGLPGWKSP
jgi:hypothetical protein